MKDYDALFSGKELVILRSAKGGLPVLVSLTGQLVSCNEETGDIVVKITGIYGIEFYGAELSCFPSVVTVTGEPNIKFSRNEIHNIHALSTKVFIDLE